MKPSSIFHVVFSALGRPSAALLLGCALVSPVRAEDRPHAPSWNESQFREQVRSLERRRDRPEQAREAELLLKQRWFSSQQVQAIASAIRAEDARYDFVLAAYPRTVDPENFYAVYDAFTNFSRVFRLHDQIQQLRAPAGPPPARVVFQPVSDETMAEILKTVREESFDNTKLTVARQILSGKRRFLSRQVLELVKLFNFENTRLEIAKAGYDAVIDPENYFVVNSAFSFASSKEILAQHIESRKAAQPSRPTR